jgi:hypothetical protein
MLLPRDLLVDRHRWLSELSLKAVYNFEIEGHGDVVGEP